MHTDNAHGQCTWIKHTDNARIVPTQKINTQNNHKQNIKC